MALHHIEKSSVLKATIIPPINLSILPNVSIIDVIHDNAVIFCDDFVMRLCEVIAKASKNKAKSLGVIFFANTRMSKMTENTEHPIENFDSLYFAELRGNLESCKTIIKAAVQPFAMQRMIKSNELSREKSEKIEEVIINPDQNVESPAVVLSLFALNARITSAKVSMRIAIEKMQFSSIFY